MRRASWLLFLAACATPPVDLERTVAGVYVRSKGRGPDLVLLHGLGDSSVGWRKLEAPLREAGYRVTAWDALGAGRSARPEGGDYRAPAHVARLELVLDDLGIRRATLVANSYGGSVALLFALRHPRRVERLVLISPAAYPEGGWTGTWLWESTVSGALEKVPPKLIANLALRMIYGDAGRIRKEDLEIYTQEAARPGALHAFVLQQRQLMPPPEVAAEWIASYPRLDMPTLILWGTRDRILGPKLGERLHEALPRSRLVRLEGIGHAPQLEAPERVVSEILAFLE